MNESIFSTLNSQTSSIAKGFSFNTNTHNFSFNAQNNQIDPANEQKSNSFNNHTTAYNSNHNYNHNSNSNSNNNSNSISNADPVNIEKKIQSELAKFANWNDLIMHKNIKLHQFFMDPLKVIKSLLDKRMKFILQLSHKQNILNAADIKLAKDGTFNKYSYWNGFNSKQFQISYPIQQENLNEELFTLNFNENITKIKIVMKHLEIAVNLINKRHKRNYRKHEITIYQIQNISTSYY